MLAAARLRGFGGQLRGLARAALFFQGGPELRRSLSFWATSTAAAKAASWVSSSQTSRGLASADSQASPKSSPLAMQARIWVLWRRSVIGSPSVQRGDVVGHEQVPHGVVLVADVDLDAALLAPGHDVELVYQGCGSASAQAPRPSA
jgi:hypothetical protein